MKLIKEKTEKQINSQNQGQNLRELSYVLFVWFFANFFFYHNKLWKNHECKKIMSSLFRKHTNIN